jgi:GTP-binding protein YchF
MRIGIVGLPNAGKSSLFTALTKVSAQTGSYPFTTIEPNVAVVPVVDRRLDEVARTVGASEIVYDTIDFHDIAGLIAGAHRGEGLGNQFLAHIRAVHAIVHVVRAHRDERVVHPEGSVDALRDVETIETELALADLELAQRRAQRVAKGAKAGDAHAAAEGAWLQEAIAALSAGRPARSVPMPPELAPELSGLGLLTAKPVLFVANVQEGESAVPPEIARAAQERGAPVLALSARAEAELAELDDAEAAALRAELGLGEEAGLERLARAAFSLLDLIAFFTAGEAKPAQSWHLREGLTAYDAAGEIHSDIQSGFVRAEIIPWEELVSAGSYTRARELGTLRIEGRDYVMRDGDVLTVRFSR